MLLISGIAAFCAGLVLNAAAHLVMATDAAGAPSTPMRRFLAGATGDGLAVTLLFVGAMTLMIFLANLPTTPFHPLPWSAAAIILAAATLAIRSLRRQAAAARAEMPEPAANGGRNSAGKSAEKAVEKAAKPAPATPAPAGALPAGASPVQATLAQAMPVQATPAAARPAARQAAAAPATPAKPLSRKERRAARKHKHAA